MWHQQPWYWLKDASVIRRTLLWLHDERHGVSNHQHLKYLFSRWFRRTSKKSWKLRALLIFVWSPVTGGFPSQRLVTWKMFPFDDVIMRRISNTSGISAYGKLYTTQMDIQTKINVCSSWVYHLLFIAVYSLYCFILYWGMRENIFSSHSLRILLCNFSSSQTYIAWILTACI